MGKRLSIFRLLAITSLGLALTTTSNVLDPAVLNHKVLHLVQPDQQATALGFTTFAGLIVASLVQPIIGVFSDRTRSRWGRLPYLVVGAAMVAACLYLIAYAPVWGAVVAGILLIQFASNTVQGPWQALIPDQVPKEQHGQAASIKGFFEIVAALAGGYAAGTIVARYTEWGQTAVTLAVTVPVAIYVIMLIVTAIGAPEGPEAADNAPKQTIREALRKTFYVDFRAYPAFGWWFGNRMLFWAALLILRTFLLLFVTYVMNMEEAAAQTFVARLNIVLGVALLIAMIPSGWLSDRIGRKWLVASSGVLAAIGTAIIFLTANPTTVTVGGAIVGLGAGIFISTNWALVTDIVPGEEAARYLGMANIATAGGSGLGRLLGALLIDPINRATGTTATGYLAVYGISVVFFLLSSVIITRLPAAKAQQTAAE